MGAISVSRIVDLVLLLCVLAAFIATIRMCALDAIRRGKSPWLVTLMVIGLFPFGLLVWLALRPKLVKPADSEEKFKLDDFRVQ